MVPYEQGEKAVSIFTSSSAFDNAQRMANFLSQSDLVPTQFRGDKTGMANCMIALELANRMQVSPFQVMQNMHIIEGKPTLSAKFLAGLLISHGYKLNYEQVDLGEKKIEIEQWFGPKGQREKKVVARTINDRGCRVVAIYNGQTLSGEMATLEMAHKEGWFDKPGSKWRTMPGVMLNYRAVSFFANQHAPDLGMGLRTTDEIEDAPPIIPDADAVYTEIETKSVEIVPEPTPVPDPNPANGAPAAGELPRFYAPDEKPIVNPKNEDLI